MLCKDPVKRPNIFELASNPMILNKIEKYANEEAND